MRLDKRLAAVTALGIDGTTLTNLDRSGIQWRLDPRLRADQQTGEMVYAGNEIDRGHLVRRASAVWGETRAEAARANADTFHYTNAAPQAAKFNQGMELWLGLESYLQDHAADNGRRLVVFTAGYVVDQTPQLADLPEVPRPGALDAAPPSGPFRTFQVPVRDIAILTGLDPATTDLRGPDAHSFDLAHPQSHFNLAATWNTAGPGSRLRTERLRTDPARARPSRA
jgi:endonuclease G